MSGGEGPGGDSVAMTWLRYQWRRKTGVEAVVRSLVEQVLAEGMSIEQIAGALGVTIGELYVAGGRPRGLTGGWYSRPDSNRRYRLERAAS